MQGRQFASCLRVVAVKRPWYPFSLTEVIMSNRPIIDFLKESRLLRKVVIVGATVAGVYFLGVKMGWWQLTIGG